MVLLGREAILAEAGRRHAQFAAAARGGELTTLAALVADGLEPVDLTSIARQLDFLAFLVDRAADGSDLPLERLAAMTRVLCEEEGFRGDVEEYDHPYNSFLGQVMARRRGLPITLSVVWLAVAERLGWPLVGVDFPGRFLVRYEFGGELLVSDPFAGGKLLSVEDCAAILAPLYGEQQPTPRLRQLARLRLEHFAAPPRIAARMLKNLEGSLLRREDYVGALNVIGKLLWLDNGEAGEWRDLGEIYHLLGEHRRALSCVREYLSVAPEATDRGLVEAFASQLERLVAGGDE